MLFGGLRSALWCICMLCLSANGYAQLKGALKKSYEALEVYNYFAAREGFYKSLRKEPIPAAYGLSIIYSRSDNPFTQPDSALKYITLARTLLPAADAKKAAAWARAGIDSTTIYRQVRLVDSTAYERLLTQADTALWNTYLRMHHTPIFLELAEARRDELAFALAQEKGTSAAFDFFIERFPAAVQVPEARRRRDRLRFEEMTGGERAEDYRNYLRTYPDGPHTAEAQEAIYRIYTRRRTPETFLLFIEENPDNPFVEQAWRNIYALEIGDMSPRAIAAFTLKYPQYPFFDELKRDFTLATTRFYPVRQGERCGFIDEKGTLRIPAVYQWCEPFVENIAVVGKNDLAYFITKDGMELTSEGFDEAYSFKNGFATVEKGGKVGVINRLGKWFIPPEYNEIGEFSEGFLYVSKDDIYGYVNNRGHIAIPLQYDQASDFRMGMAVVQRDGFYGLIDTLGNTVVNFAYHWIEPFGESPATRVRYGQKFGLVDRKGNVVLPVEFDALGEYSGGLYLAAQAGKYGFLRPTGDTAVALQYEYSQQALLQSRFINGHAKVYQKDPKERNAIKVGVIDTSGRKVLPAMFEDVGTWQGPLIAVRKKNQWGYVTPVNKLAIPYKYDTAEPFGDSLAVTGINGKLGLIDLKGKTVLPHRFTALACMDSLCLAKDEGWGLVSLSGRVVVPMAYQAVENVDGRMLLYTAGTGEKHYFDLASQRFVWREEQSEP
jgi:hypothetical protein